MLLSACSRSAYGSGWLVVAALVATFIRVAGVVTAIKLLPVLCWAVLCLQELEAQQLLVQSLQADKALLEQQLQHHQQQAAKGVTAEAAQLGSPGVKLQQLAAAAGQDDEIANMAEQLASSKKQLQEALDAAAEMQQQARQLRLQLYNR